MALPKKRRVDKILFKKIIKERKSFHSSFFSFKFILIKSSINKFSVVVSIKEEKKAVKRNFVKRRARYVLEKKLEDIKMGIAGILFIKKEARDVEFKKFENEILKILMKAKIL